MKQSQPPGAAKPPRPLLLNRLPAAAYWLLLPSPASGLITNQALTPESPRVGVTPSCLVRCVSISAGAQDAPALFPLHSGRLASIIISLTGR
jgi:hypothetical protein